MPQNITENPARGSTVVAPSSGDPVTDGSILQGEQPLADRVAHLEGFELASGQRALIHEFGGAGLPKVRIYARHTGAVITWERTFNAAWNGSVWVTDVAGVASRVQHANGGVAHEFASATTTAGGWSDAEFADDASLGLGFDPANEVAIMSLAGGYLPAAASPAPDTLYANNIPKAWGVFTTDGAGGVSIDESFNVLSASLSTVTLTVTLRQGFASASYHVSPSGGGGAVDEQPRGFGSTATTISLSMLDSSAGTLIDLEANARGLSFVAFGRQ